LKSISQVLLFTQSDVIHLPEIQETGTMIQEKKKELRRLIRQLKDKQNNEAYFRESAEIMEVVEQLPAFINASTVMAYWSIKGEVYTHDFIKKWSHRKRIILPSVDGDRMNLKLYRRDINLIPGDLFSIPEPDGPLFDDYESIDMILIPGIAFDHTNNRMGRGKAYYDRFLQSSKAIKTGVCFNFQLFDEIPADEHDIRMDMVITNRIRKQ
jgi:5-formyltetrahydrofolate cyclo-ligase